MFLQRKRQETVVNTKEQQLQILDEGREAAHKMLYKVGYTNLKPPGKM